jgi:hypothetical protein
MLGAARWAFSPTGRLANMNHQHPPQTPAAPARSLPRALAFVVLLWVGTAAIAGETIAPDARLTSTTQLLAGRASDYPPHAQVVTLDAWQKHRKWLAPRWDRMRRTKISVIENWRNEALKADLDRCRTLLYPFSGPDFLNAYVMFPRCDTYVLFGLEPPGEMPALETLSPAEAAAFFGDVRVAFRDILARNYFITKHMSEQLKTPALNGALPLMLASMGLLDLGVVAVEPFDLAKISGPHAHADVNAERRAKGIKLTFFKPPEGKLQTLYYLSLNVTNGALRANPEFLPFLESFKPTMTLIKSAAYLMQLREFTHIRNTLLDVTDVLVQDDTGIPYAFLVGRKFEIRLYGHYAPPISEFPNAYQQDLAAAFEQPGEAAPLPFPFGYHWKEGTSGLIVARNAALHP